MVKKKLTLFAFLTIVICSICGGVIFGPDNVSNNNDISLNIEVKKPGILIVSVENKTGHKVTYSENYHIEKKTFLCWHRISIAPTTFPLVELYRDPRAKSSPQSINYEVIYGNLSKGEYRLIKEFDIDGEILVVAGYFNIT